MRKKWAITIPISRRYIFGA